MAGKPVTYWVPGQYPNEKFYCKNLIIQSVATGANVAEESLQLLSSKPPYEPWLNPSELPSSVPMSKANWRCPWRVFGSDLHPERHWDFLVLDATGQHSKMRQDNVW